MEPNPGQEKICVNCKVIYFGNSKEVICPQCHAMSMAKVKDLQENKWYQAEILTVVSKESKKGTPYQEVVSRLDNGVVVKDHLVLGLSIGKSMLIAYKAMTRGRRLSMQLRMHDTPWGYHWKPHVLGPPHSTPRIALSKTAPALRWLADKVEL